VASDGRIGFIGLGIMGAPMARNLLTAGYELTVHSRSPGPVEELVAIGARPADDPSGVAAASDVTITMLPDTADVEAVMTGPNGVAEGARAGSLVIDMSSIDPGPTRHMAETLAASDVDMLDAPVSGGERGAIDGTLSIMAGGPDDAFARAEPIFGVLGANVVHVGPSGAGQVCKACNQLVVASTIEAVAEALLLAQRSGLDPARVRAALLGGFAGSKILEVHGQRMLDGAFDPGFRIRLHRKDARIVESAAEETRTPVPAFAVVAQQLQRSVDAGDGDRDHSALFAELVRECGSRDDAAHG
jgi:2-hydroxy-3-oxopropionate reductase